MHGPVSPLFRRVGSKEWGRNAVPDTPGRSVASYSTPRRGATATLPFPGLRKPRDYMGQSQNTVRYCRIYGVIAKWRRPSSTNAFAPACVSLFSCVPEHEGRCLLMTAKRIPISEIAHEYLDCGSTTCSQTGLARPGSRNFEGPKIRYPATLR